MTMQDQKERTLDQFSDEEKKQWLTDHFCYEVWMLITTHGNDIIPLSIPQHLLKTQNDDGVDWKTSIADNNARLESFMIHARSLADFFYNVNKRYNTDVLAIDFINQEKWEKLLPEPKKNLDELLKRISQEIVHLTTKRHSPFSHHKFLPVKDIYFKTLNLIKIFIDQLPNLSLSLPSINIRKEIEEQLDQLNRI